jgi:hypothetical protein
MTVAKMLKTQKRLTHKIANLQREIKSYNRYRTARPVPKVNAAEQYKLLLDAVRELIEVKVALFKAGEPIRLDLMTMAEKKGLIAFLAELDTTETTGYGEDTVEFTVVFDAVIKKDMIEKLQKEVYELQDRIDVFNASTTV